jgi:hypothetical protein
MIRVVHPEPDPDFLPIPDPDPQHCWWRLNAQKWNWDDEPARLVLMGGGPGPVGVAARQLGSTSST